MTMSPLSKITLDGRDFLVKRDDKIDKYLSGNKYRKLYTLLNTPKNRYKTIISYGGTQSNAMLAIAAICKEKGWEFLYYTKPLSKKLNNEIEDNLFYSLSLGMKHTQIEFELYRNYVASLSLSNDEYTFVIDQGGADRSAKEGLEVLADEIRAENLEVKSVATPSGTGTTALYLALALPEYKVYTTPCVGDVTYLREQMSALAEIPTNLIILEPEKKYHFAKLYDEFYEVYEKLKDGGIEFDLLYSPAMWMALISQTEEKVLYIHSGGVTGNVSMLERYKRRRKNPLLSL